MTALTSSATVTTAGGEYVEDGPQRESHSEPAHEHSRLLERSRTFIVAA
jgi:hypothetical protein